MVKYESFRKVGARYSVTPFRSCSVPAEVLKALAREMVNKYLYHCESVKRVTRNRCECCGSFEEITFYWHTKDGDTFKTVYTVPLT